MFYIFSKSSLEKSYPEMDKLIKMCQIFECSLDDLVTGDVPAAESPSGRTWMVAPRHARPQRPSTAMCPRLR